MFAPGTVGPPVTTYLPLWPVVRSDLDLGVAKRKRTEYPYLRFGDTIPISADKQAWALDPADHSMHCTSAGTRLSAPCDPAREPAPGDPLLGRGPPRLSQPDDRPVWVGLLASAAK